MPGFSWSWVLKDTNENCRYIILNCSFLFGLGTFEHKCVTCNFKTCTMYYLLLARVKTTVISFRVLRLPSFTLSDCVIQVTKRTHETYFLEREASKLKNARLVSSRAMPHISQSHHKIAKT